MDEPRKPLPAVVRYLLLAFAVVCVVIGVVALFIPGLPTTVFILIAGWAAARSSPRFHDWLINHRHFGPMIRDWRAHGAVSRRAKITATVMMSCSAVIFFYLSPRRWVAELLTVLMALVLMWLWLRPEPPPKAPRP